jgi:anti-sigma regulatory factor (Ser/Thr protein kinase)
MSKNLKNKTEKICINAFTEELVKVRALIEHFTEGAGFSEDSSFKIQLVIDEICSNIIKHSYSQIKQVTLNKDTLKICLELKKEEKGILVRIIDQGPPFNPIEFDSPEISEQIAHPHKGGLGIPLIKLLSDQISYKKLKANNFKNQLEIRFKFK